MIFECARLTGPDFAERLALTYQLESLHQQAAQLAATSWSGNLRIEMNKERTELKVGYWWCASRRTRSYRRPH